MSETDLKAPGPVPPDARAPAKPGDGSPSARAIPEEPDPASPIFDILGAGSRTASPRVAQPPENIVAEIVDQITEKQARAAHRPEPAAAGQETCSFCLEEAVETGTPYRLVLKCTSGENEVP